MKKFKLNFNSKDQTKKEKNTQTTSSKNPKKKRSTKDIIAIVMCVVLVIGVLGVSASLLYLKNTLDSAPTLNVNDFLSQESTKIYDRDGNQIADLGLESRENITYNDLPQSIIDAFVAVEDSRFFQHNGFDLPRFIKSAIENLKTLSFEQGGSTFTMQLVKNTYFTNSGQSNAIKSVDRKLQEIFLAMELENKVNKKVILEHYLNMINFGAGNTRGVQNAARYFFNKDVSELTLSESALLAGVINAPGAYNPYRYLDRATERRNTVLDLMVRHGYITQAEADLAKSIKVEDLLVQPGSGMVSTSNTKYLGYINTVVEEVMDATGQDPYTTSMRIYTYMDPTVQDQIEAIQNGEEAKVQFPDDLMQVSMVVLDNQTGELLGIGGGRNDIVAKGFNRATQMYKQPGSTVKPFLSYALAFEVLGWASSHVVEDRPTYYRGTNTALTNFSNTYAGQVTLKDAVGNSLNTPAYRTLEEIIDTWGRENVVKYLQDLGFSKVTNDNFDAQYSIGGGKFEVTPVELAAAHATMINAGQYIEPHTVNYIEFNNGDSPYYSNKSAVQVLSAESAYLVALLEENAVSGPYSNFMQLLKRNYPIYAKTGTTDYGSSGLEYNIPKGAAKEKWMVASSSQYTTLVWVGYDKAVKDEGTYFSSAKSRLNLPGNIIKLLLDAVHEGKETPTGVTKPEGITNITHILAMFPYTAPVEGMDSQYIVTGQINKKFATLVSFEATNSIEQLTGFDASMNNNGGTSRTFNFGWAEYPVAQDTEGSDGTYDISLTLPNGRVIAATGRLLFSPNWIFGAVEYRVRIVANGNQIYEGNEHSVTLDIGGDTTVSVCGYYARGSSGLISNEICHEFRTEHIEEAIYVPNFGSASEAQSFASSNGLSWSANTTPANRASDINKIQSVTIGGSEIQNTSRYKADLQGAVYTYYVDNTVSLPSGTVGDAKNWFSSRGVSLSSSGSDSDTVSSFTINGNTYAPGASIQVSQLTGSASATPVVAPPTVSVAISQTANGDGSYTLTANITSGGTGSDSYSWSSTSGASSGGQSITVANSEVGQTYTVTVSNSNGSASASATIGS